MIFEKLSKLCQQLEQETNQISAERQALLLSLSAYLSKKYNKKETPKAIVICTHNSRRSHYGQLWLALAADYYQLSAIETYSGGTEATAFNPRAVTAAQGLGFQIEPANTDTSNILYHVQWKEGMQPSTAFSKKYTHSVNPQSDFAAIMVCSQADNGCPIVFGAEYRLSLPFKDPKAFDDTDLEAAKYEERCRDIGREMLFVMKNVNRKML